MKDVLIITDLAYASPRIPGLCKYLAETGWKATVLTTPIGKIHRERIVVPNNYARIIEVPYSGMMDFWKKFVGFNVNKSLFAQLEQKFPSSKNTFIESLLTNLFILGGTLFAYPDEMRGWCKPSIKAALKLIENEKFDAILSSSFPLTSHLIAQAITKRSGIPWLADLRDLWTQNHNYLFPKRKIFETKLEKNILSQAAALSTVSDSLSQKLQNRYPSAYVSVISNGFDSDLINEPAFPLTEKFTITYTGLIYKGKQNPAKLFAALKDLLSAGLMNRAQVLVRFYGMTQKWITHLAHEFNFQDIVIQYGQILRDEVIIKQRESQILLLCGWEEEYETGVMPLKMFEYFAARRPILATGGTANEQFRTILDETKAGHHAIEVNDIKNILYNHYRDYLKKKKVSYHGVPSLMDKYSYRYMANKFANVLNQIVNKTEN